MQSPFIIRVLATFIGLTLFSAIAVVADDAGSPEETLAAREAQGLVPPRPQANERVSRGSQRSSEQPVIVTIAPGESLQEIADSHGVTLQHLFDANPQVQNPNLVEAGLQLRIPTPGEGLEHRLFPAPPAPEPDPPAIQQPSVPAPPPAHPAPAPEPEFDGGVWDRLAQCEASGNWQANTGNGYYGGLQFLPSTWKGFGGHQYAPNAHLATREQQIEIAKRTQASQGWGAWPACSRELGLR